MHFPPKLLKLEIERSIETSCFSGKNMNLMNQCIHYQKQMIMNNNSTYGSGHIVDELCVTRNTRRWAVLLYYNLLNTLSINSFITYMSIYLEYKTSRRMFL
ncbi:hypothetical protein J437_LFUL007166 [Ladona fulva]|uniref:Uncharacterized protein n=1 Tax=Ladona fulva TaxID=123851 RepID=A0A8K0K7M4_LADFU|nr:hypothetical protein J437_LFUL007166 [Ladona fulva]